MSTWQMSCFKKRWEKKTRGKKSWKNASDRNVFLKVVNSEASLILGRLFWCWISTNPSQVVFIPLSSNTSPTSPEVQPKLSFTKVLQRRPSPHHRPSQTLPSLWRHLVPDPTWANRNHQKVPWDLYLQVKYIDFSQIMDWILKFLIAFLVLCFLFQEQITPTQKDSIH